MIQDLAYLDYEYEAAKKNKKKKHGGLGRNICVNAWPWFSVADI